MGGLEKLDQPTINIGTIGHVAHGKSTLIAALTGKQTSRFKNELERNITIKLGYANSRVFKCTNQHCPSPGCYKSIGFFFPIHPICDQCHYTMKLIRHISFIDCPGHEILMSTMLNGASLMTGAILVIAGNESCPQPQTSEHVAAFNTLGIKNLIVVQNKIDLISNSEVKKNLKEVRKFLINSKLKNAPIVPVSAQRKCNIDVLTEKIIEIFPNPAKHLLSNLKTLLIRSFDINKPGLKLKNSNGGVVGGSLVCGRIFIGEKIEICPGICTKSLNGKLLCFSFKSRVVSISSENKELSSGNPGGLLGIGTTIDPFFTRGDRIAGQVLGHIGKTPLIFDRIIICYKLFKRLVGIQKNNEFISPLKKNEILLINIGTASTGGKINKMGKNIIQIYLLTPICCDLSSKVTLSRRINRHWRLIGWGLIKKGWSDKILKL